jgi:HD superfamily phosphohydrolase
LIAEGPAVPAALDDIHPRLGERVLQLLHGEVSEPRLRYLADLVSSSLDCDRMDYLRRDALYTGTQYGVFDRDWLIREMIPTADGEAIVVVEKGRTAVEQYLIGRYHMFQNVYLHKTSRGFETAFRGLCTRLQKLGVDALPSQSRAFRALLAPQMSLETFLQLNDLGFEAEFSLLLDAADPTVRAFARALDGRHPLRQRTSLTGPAELQNERTLRMEDARRRGLDPECAVWQDTAKDVPYHPYDPSGARRGLRVQRREGDLVDITDVSPTIRALAGPVEVHRLYWIGDVE